MRRTDAFRTATFRTAALAASVYAFGTVLLFGLVWWRTTAYETAREAAFLAHESAAIARQAPGEIAADVSARFAGDLHRQTFAAVLTPGRRVVAGDLAAYPAGLPVDARPHATQAARQTTEGPSVEPVNAIARLLPDGRILVVGRSTRELTRLGVLVGQALVLGLVPAVLLALGAGAWAGMRTTARVAAFRQALDRILDGGLRERLPHAGTRDTLDVLAASVNRALDRLERLLGEVRGAGDAIAHDLRTPLARMRARLEGGRRRSTTLAELDAVAEQATGDLDRCFATITALLRIGEIEGAQRRSGFADADLSAIVAEAAELYQPMAELRDLLFTVQAAPGLVARGDRDLLFEVCANLLDNAIKFAPAGGEVRVALSQGLAAPLLTVADSGAGIPPGERQAVLQRFYRADRMRGVEGSGLGLSLVAAILRLHDFKLTMQDLPPGFAVQVECGPSAPDDRPSVTAKPV